MPPNLTSRGLLAPKTESGPVRAVIEAMLSARLPGATICPSEVARKLARTEEIWREQMPVVHEVVDQMLAEHLVDLSWKGKRLTARHGPYRIGLRFAE